MKALLTGSHVYGTPTNRSDVDLVIRCDVGTRDRLIELIRPIRPEVAEAAEEGDYEVTQVKISSGRRDLNILFAVTDEEYLAWATGTAKLTSEQPVTRDRAVKVFRKLRKMLGVTG